jgi:hypothetical protein
MGRQQWFRLSAVRSVEDRRHGTIAAAGEGGIQFTSPDAGSASVVADRRAAAIAR